jgi:hypothetical protein
VAEAVVVEEKDLLFQVLLVKVEQVEVVQEVLQVTEAIHKVEVLQLETQ